MLQCAALEARCGKIFSLTGFLVASLRVCHGVCMYSFRSDLYEVTESGLVKSMVPSE